MVAKSCDVRFVVIRRCVTKRSGFDSRQTRLSVFSLAHKAFHVCDDARYLNKSIVGSFSLTLER